MCNAIFNGQHTAGSQVHRNFVADCVKGQFKALKSSEKEQKIKIVTNFVKNRNVTFQEVLFSEEFLTAFDILRDIEASNKHYISAFDLIRSTISLIDLNSLDVEMKLFNAIMFLQSTLQLAIESQKTSKIETLCELFACFGEKFIPKIVSGDVNVKPIVFLLLEFTKFFKLAPLTYSFWLRLIENLKILKIKDFSDVLEQLILNLATCLITKKSDAIDDCKSFKVKKKSLKFAIKI